MTIVRSDDKHGPEERDLGEFDILVRDSRALAILQKVLTKSESALADLVSGDTPFGLPSNFRGYRKGAKHSSDLRLLMNEGGARVEHWVEVDVVRKNTALINEWKVLVPKAGSDGGQKLPDYVLGIPVIASPRTVCSQTYLVVGPVSDKQEAEAVIAYLKTRFTRFLVSLRKISQDAMKSVYTWVPQQTWDRTWTDEELYRKYGITEDEQAYIESMVKEMP